MRAHIKAHHLSFLLATFLAIPAVSADMVIATSELEELEAVMITRENRGQPGSTMPLVAERLRVSIDNQHATSTLLQTYQNRSGSVTEGSFSLQAGRGTRAEGFAYWNGEQKIVGEVFEKEVAREIYRRVTSRRRDPGLLEQADDGVFSFRVFPINPNEKKRVSVTYSKWLGRSGKTIRYRAPLSMRNSDVVIEIRSQRPISSVRSKSHGLEVDTLSGGGVRIRLKPGSTAKTLDLSYQLVESPWNLSAFVHRDQGQDGYFAISLAAPADLADKVSPKDVTIVLDRSGSMSGRPLAQARDAAANIIRRLGKRDRVNVVAFDDDVDPLFEVPRSVAGNTRARAIEFVESLSPGGGTDLALALRSAMNAQNSTSKRPQVVLFLTDGKSPPQAAIDVATADKNDVRVFAVGLGTQVNKPLLSRLSRLKRGQVAYIDDTRNIERDIGRVYRQISRPLLVNVSVDIQGASSARRVYPRTLPDVFVDDELVVKGRLRGEAGPVTFIVRGDLDGRPVVYRKKTVLRSTVRRPWVGRMWALARIDHLLEDLALDGNQSEKRQEVTELALAYNVVTQFTSFLAIPEHEAIGQAKAALDNARQRKREVLQKHKDAIALTDGTNSGAPMKVVDPSAQDGQGEGDDDDDDDGDDFDDDDARMNAEPTSQGDAVSGHPGSARKKSGCAGCSAPGSGNGLAGLLLVLAVIGLRPRRLSETASGRGPSDRCLGRSV